MAQQKLALLLERTGKAPCILLLCWRWQPHAIRWRLAGVTVPVEGASRVILDAAAGQALVCTPTTVACHPLVGGDAQVLTSKADRSLSILA